MTGKIEKTINEVTYQSIETNIGYLTSDFDKLYGGSLSVTQKAEEIQWQFSAQLDAATLGSLSELHLLDSLFFAFLLGFLSLLSKGIP